MTELSNWIPTLIAAGALAAHWYLVKAAIKEQNDEVEEKIRDFEKQFMTTDTHRLLCENNTLKIREYFNEEMNKLKNDIFVYLRKLEKIIAESK